MCALGVIWGGSFLFIKISLETVGPWTSAAMRTLIAGIFLSVIAPAMGQHFRHIQNLKSWVYGILIGAISIALPLYLLSWGQQHVSSAFAGVSMSAVPLLVLPLVYIFSPDESIGPRRIIGFLLGFLGILVLFDLEFTKIGSNLTEVLGQLACFTAALCYAVGSVMTRNAPRMPQLIFAAITLMAAALILTPLALYYEGVPTEISLRSLSSLLYLAVFASALGAVLRIHITKSAGSLFMSLTTYQIPIWAIVYSVTFSNEELPPTLFIGLLIILLGIGISQSRAIIGFLKN